jgi:uncharacterized protein involved in outer membrane biogenesis
MTKLARRLFIGTGIFAAIALVGATCVALFFDVDRYKSSIESAVSGALGMEFRIRGKVSLRLLPHLLLKFPDIHLSDGQQEILWAKELQVSPRWIPFIIHRRLSIDQIALEHPKIRVEQSLLGRGQVTQDTSPQPGTMSLVSVHHGAITYVDRTSGKSVDVGNLELRLIGISWGHGTARQPFALLNSLSFHGTLQATTLQLGAFRAADLSCRMRDSAGLLQLDSTAVALFGGISRGSLTLDVTGSSPRIRLVQAASRIDLTQVFPIRIFLGTAQASLDVEGTGNDLRAITATLQGQVSIRSDHISINSLDVDGLVADYNRTQNFSLIDLGSLVIAGPFAPLLTKGVDFSRLRFFGRMGKGTSEIRRVVSDWTIVDGVARTKDVAFTTPKNTVAFRGDLNLLTANYQNLFVATVDQQGCAQVKRRVSGPLAHPKVEGPGSAALGPFKSAFRSVKKLFQSRQCDLFYAGSAIH